VINAATWLVYTLGAYALIGLVFALIFVFSGVNRMDSAAREGSLGFRLLIIPGVSALWPIFARRWLRGDQGPPQETNAHREASVRPKAKAQ
jgi:hypothetical protein